MPISSSSSRYAPRLTQSKKSKNLLKIKPAGNSESTSEKKKQKKNNKDLGSGQDTKATKKNIQSYQTEFGKVINDHRKSFEPTKDIYIIIRQPFTNGLKIKVDRETGEILTPIIDILKLGLRFFNIIAFEPKSFKENKAVYQLHEVQYWVTCGSNAIKVMPGKTSKYTLT